MAFLTAGDLKQAVRADRRRQRMRPSAVPRGVATEAMPDQELTVFGRWRGDNVWVPPEGQSDAMAATVLDKHGWRFGRSRESLAAAWRSVVRTHRDSFTRVRELELADASIRLPKGRVFMSVLPQEHFDRIEEDIPACVQTRLDEFLSGPAERLNAKVYYLKPLCVEVGSDLIFTTADELRHAVDGVRDDVFAAARRLRWRRLPREIGGAAARTLTWPVRSVVGGIANRRRRAVEAFRGELEFQRRRTAHRAMRLHRRCRTDGCTYDDMLNLTNPLVDRDVIDHYAAEKELSDARRRELIEMAAGKMPWFFALSMATFKAVTVGLAVNAWMASPVLACDPVFVAEIPGRDGELLKIGHFDTVDGVVHVEL